MGREKNEGGRSILGRPRKMDTLERRDSRQVQEMSQRTPGSEATE